MVFGGGTICNATGANFVQERIYKQPMDTCMPAVDGSSSSSKITLCEMDMLVVREFFSNNDCSGTPSRTMDYSALGCNSVNN